MRLTERPAFDPTVISASRVDQFLSCGVAFRYRYIDRLPPETMGSSALYGQAIHRALETWAPDRSQKLGDHLTAAWQHVTAGTSVAEFLQAYDSLAREAVALCDAIQERRPDLRAPRMTNDFKKSEVAARIAGLLKSWGPRLNDESPWQFSERDPLPSLYEDSLRVMREYARKWHHLPAPYLTEFHFNVEWNGFILNGYIDSVEPVVDRETGEVLALGIIDYKTYAREPAEFKDWRQGAIYLIAIQDLVDREQFPRPSVPLLFGIDYVRLGERRFWRGGPNDEQRLLKELRIYRERVKNGEFLPACKSTNPDYCEYPSICCLRSQSGTGGAMSRVEVNV